jgi:hypothetical protein
MRDWVKEKWGELWKSDEEKYGENKVIGEKGKL